MLKYLPYSHWNSESMARRLDPAHPLSTTRTDYAPSCRSEEFPRKEAFDATAKPVAVDQHAGQQTSTLYPAREQSHSRRGTPTPTLTWAEANEAVPQMPEPVQVPLPTRPRGYSTTSSSRRGTPTPTHISTSALASASTTTFTSMSTSTSASVTPTLPGSLPPNPVSSNPLLRRSDSSRVVDNSERRELHPYPSRKRRNAEDDLRTSLTEKEKANSSLTQQLFSTRNDLGEAMKKNGLLQHRVQGLLDEKSKALMQLEAAQKKATEKEQVAAKKIADLEAANRKKDDELAEKEKENSSLKQHLLSTGNDRAEARKKNGLLQHRVQGLLDEKSKVLTQLEAAQKKATENEQAAAKKIADLEAANRKKDDELRVAQSRLRASEEKQSNLSKLLELRTADLKGVQPFLTTVDAYSCTEIIAMVETLNAEIFQTAAYMAELIEDESMAAPDYERIKNVERNRQMLETQLRRDLGEDLWQYFQKNHVDIRGEPLPLQLAFQCALSRWSTLKIRTFLLGHFGDQLGKVYQMIRESEAQTVAGRWRALTNAQLNSLKDDYPPNVVVDILIKMLFFCGWSSSSDKAKKAMLLMQQMVFNIEKMANQIKAATKEGITTADLDVFVIRAGEPLKDGMEDIFSENASVDAYSFQMSNKRVLCTVGMGLRRTTVKLTEGRPPEYKEEILLEPKVALVSVLDSTCEGMEL